MGTNIFTPVILTLDFELFLENFNLDSIIRIVSPRALIFNNIILLQDLSEGTKNFNTVTLTFEFDLFFENFNFANKV